MSRINDALKRAKEAQQDTPPPAHEPQLRPADLARQTTRGVGVVMPFAFLLITLAGLLFLWQVREKNAAQSQPLAAANPVPATPPVPPPSLPLVPNSSPKTVVAPVATEAARRDEFHESQPTSPVALATPVVSQPSPIKLQAIFFIPRNPTAMINGHTVRSGDQINGYRVAGINQTSITLVSARQTNVLTLNSQ